MRPSLEWRPQGEGTFIPYEGSVRVIASLVLPLELAMKAHVAIFELRPSLLSLAFFEPICRVAYF